MGRIAAAAGAVMLVAAGTVAVAAPGGADGTTGAIGGVVTAAAGGVTLSGICVTATPPGPGGGNATTGSDGSYTISGLTPGPYSVEFSTGCGNSGNYAPQWWNGASTQQSGTPVQVSAGSTVGGTNAQLVTGGTIGGVVAASAGGAPLAGICVSAWGNAPAGQRAQPSGTATTGSDGSYSIDGLAQGQYAVEFANGCGNGNNYVTQWWNGASSQQNANPVQVNAGSTVNSINAQMVIGGTISGTVTAAVGGQLLQGVCVSVSPTSGSGATLTAVTAADGTYSVQGLAAGTFDVEFLDGSSCSFEGGISAGYEPQYFDGQSSQASATPVTVVADAVTGSVSAQMVVGGSISGNVVALNGGAPLQNICVSAIGVQYPVFGTAPDGSFTITGLATGTYTVQFTNGCGNPMIYVPQSVQVSVTAPDPTTGVEVQMVVGTAPTVTSVSPNNGPPSGNTPVTIMGTGFTGATQVRFGFSSSPFTVVSDNEITTTSPMAPAGQVDVQVTSPEGTSFPSMSDKFTYTSGTNPAPTVISLNPASGTVAGGTTVTITGTNLSGTTGVMFGMSAATSFSVLSDTEVSAVSPQVTYGGPVELTVNTPNGSSMMTPGSQFTYLLAPNIWSPSMVGFVAGHTNTLTITASGYPVPSVTVGPGLPSWMVFTSGMGQMLVSGTPPARTKHVYTLNVTATNSAGSASQTLTLTVGSPPVFTSATSVSLHVGVDKSFTVRAKGYPAPTLTETGNLPSGVMFSSPANGSARLSGAPAPGSEGVYPITATANSATGMTQQSILVTVGEKR